jgi:trehalose synthase
VTDHATGIATTRHQPVPPEPQAELPDPPAEPQDGEAAEDEPAQHQHEPSEITYHEQFYPARPRSLRPRGRLRNGQAAPAAPAHEGEPVASNPAYVRWLVEQSMLNDARTIAGQFSGVGSMWQNPYANPDPRAAIDTASVWFTAYPISVMTKPGCSFLGTLADEALWKVFQQVGIDAVHSGPVKRAGGLTGWDPTPTVDGHFDRISTHIDPMFGTEDEFRQMCEVAAAHGGTVIDDIVPGHTGKGPDFRLAEMKIGDYPGIYHMVEIAPEDWYLLPEVPPYRDSMNIDFDAEDRLEKAGYIIGRLQRVIFHDPGVKDTNWSATHEITGPDGVTRRWVYLHYFKQGQPSINWLDPTFAGMRLVVGDALHSLADLGSGALRFDANGFLGVEKSTSGEPAWSEGHPLSQSVNQFLASMVRKLGAFSFQELNLTIDDIKATSGSGADLSYDFVNRPAYHHALATGDTEFLRLTLNAARDLGVDPAGLVHALQNHDELTYELVHFATLHRDDVFTFRGNQISGAELATTVRADLVERITGEHAPFNLIFTTNGIASTTASVIAAALAFRDPAYSRLDELTAEQVEAIKRAHLLLAMFNALQPGVFALSGWDLSGSLTVDRDRIENLVAGGDTRWIHRGAYDLMGYRPDVDQSLSEMPRAAALYGDLPGQLADESSFLVRLARILDVRKRYGIAVAEQVDVPEVSNRAMLVMVHRLADGDRLQVTVLNFDPEPVAGSVRSEQFTPRSTVTDMLTDEVIAEVDDLATFTIVLGGHQGMTLLLELPPEPEVA